MDQGESMRATSAVLVVAIAAVACGGDATTGDASGEWVGTVTTEGDVTTVSNDAGSKWGGPARLVEELSIGVETGAPEYMLGSIGGMWIDDDEIYLIDSQVPIVRVYDGAGRHLRDIGAEGQGPGEYERPGDVLVGPDGRVYVSDGGGDRINVYSADGTSLETWRWGSDSSTRMMGSLTMRHDGSMLTSAYIMPRPEDVREGMVLSLTSGVQGIGPEGAEGEFLEMPDLEVERIQIPIDDRRTRTVSYSPGQVSTYTPSGAWVVGDSSDYSFEIHYPDGRIVRSRRYWDPVPIEADHAEYLRRTTVFQGRRANPDFDWDGDEIPTHKTAYYSFYPTQGNRFLVVREGPSHRVEGCDMTFDMNVGPEEECYRPERTWDMFDLEGNYLGEVIRPQFARLWTPFFRDDLLLLVVEDELGTVMVKRFRFQLPGETDRP